MQCACYVAESEDNHPLRLKPCPEHERWAKAIRDYERDACAQIADGELMEVHAAGEERIVKSIAEQIRARSNFSD